MVVFIPEGRAQERIFFDGCELAQLPRNQIRVVAPVDRRVNRPVRKPLGTEPEILDLRLFHCRAIAKATAGNQLLRIRNRFIRGLATARARYLLLFLAKLLIKITERLIKGIFAFSGAGSIAVAEDFIEAVGALTIAATSTGAG